MKTAILVDLDFFIRRYTKLSNQSIDNNPQKKALQIVNALKEHCNKHLNYNGENHTLYRIYVYDCPPISKKMHHPKTNKLIDFSKTDIAIFRNALHNEIKKMPLTALRLGKLDEDNIKWTISDSKKYKKLLRGDITIDDIDENLFKIEVKQKQVDMKIGIDITWLSLKKLVEQIILISGDSDFVPASKLARREGIRFILDAMYHSLKDDLLEHIDLLRTPKLKCEEK